MTGTDFRDLGWREKGREGTHEQGSLGRKRAPSLEYGPVVESNNKPGVNPLPGRKLSLKPDEATAVQRESDTQTREQLLITHRKGENGGSGPGGRWPGFV